MFYKYRNWQTRKPLYLGLQNDTLQPSLHATISGTQDFVILCFVCLFVNRNTGGHNSKLIVMKLHQVVEVASTEKPIDFELKGHLELKFIKSSFIIQLT